MKIIQASEDLPPPSLLPTFSSAGSSKVVPAEDEPPSAATATDSQATGPQSIAVETSLPVSATRQAEKGGFNYLLDSVAPMKSSSGLSFGMAAKVKVSGARATVSASKIRTDSFWYPRSR